MAYALLPGVQRNCSMGPAADQPTESARLTKIRRLTACGNQTYQDSKVKSNLDSINPDFFSLTTVIDQYVSEKIGKTSLSDSNTGFMDWVVKHNRL